MLALQITGLKNFMNELLIGDLFDVFVLEEAVVAAPVTYTVEGRLNRDFFSEEDWAEKQGEEFADWADMKGICLSFIKGKRTPLHFKFVFHLKRKHMQSVLQKGSAGAAATVKALVLTLRYDGERALLCTGTSHNTFTTDKEAERLWDASLKQYLAKKGVACEEL